jgi:hypothetical protein
LNTGATEHAVAGGGFQAGMRSNCRADQGFTNVSQSLWRSLIKQIAWSKVRENISLFAGRLDKA